MSFLLVLLFGLGAALDNAFFQSFQLSPPGPPRAVPPVGVPRAPPGIEPMTYAVKHGVSLETDEEGAYRVGGQVQEGYENLYFEASTMVPTDPQKRMSREKSLEEMLQAFRDSTKVTLTFEPEGSGQEDDVIMDTAVEISNNRMSPLDGTVFVGNLVPQVAKKKSEQRTTRLLNVSGETAKVLKSGSKLRIPAVGENAVKIPYHKLLQILDGTAAKPRRHRTSKFENTSFIYHPDTLQSFRGKSRQGLHRGRGNWKSRRKVLLDRVTQNQLRKIQFL